jgi:acetyl esterase/lipase
MKKVLVFILILASNMLYAQEVIKLYDVVPNSKTSDITEKSETAADGITRVSQVVSPEIIIYRPEKPNGTAVLICPGGGYRILAITHEGHDVARVFNQWGVTAFVLKYRLPDDKTMMDKTIGPLQDAERGIQLIRQNAKQWGVDPKKVGVMGFSAGGHLAASLSTKYTQEVIENHKHTSLRPDFSVLVYPVISFTDSLGHTGSRDNLIGKNPYPGKIRKFSNELLVNKKTPPAFLVHAKDDGAVPFGNSVVYYEALQKNKIPAAIRLFEKGGHGFGMHNKKEAGDWMSELQQWLVKEKFLKK